MVPEILWLACSASERNRERAGYFDAFERMGIDLRYLDEPAARAALRARLARAEESIVLYPDPPKTPIPDWLPQLNVVGACFQIDSFSKPDWRSLWSTLFDFVFIFHPDPQGIYTAGGRTGVEVLPHAVDAEAYRELPAVRTFDLGWVGTVTGPHNVSRQRLLPKLASEFRVNDYDRFYGPADVPKIYQSARIVVNISRDDHPSDANTRCFEAMAAGALLMTRLPSELQSFGFLDGIHFVGFRREDELSGLIRTYLDDEPARALIAATARELVLTRHTYDARGAQMITTILSQGRRHRAPARTRTRASRAYAYCHYYAKKQMLGSALSQVLPMAASDPLRVFWAAPLIARSCWHRLKTASHR
jgi:Glycosyl transferases group 1